MATASRSLSLGQHFSIFGHAVTFIFDPLTPKHYQFVFVPKYTSGKSLDKLIDTWDTAEANRKCNFNILGKGCERLDLSAPKPNQLNSLIKDGTTDNSLVEII